MANNIAYENMHALPNKFLNPDGTYATLSEILSGSVDTDLFIVVDELPAIGQANKIYLLVSGNELLEYIWINDKWDPVGTADIDLSKYSTTEEMNIAIASALDSAKVYTDEAIQTSITQVLGGSY